MAEPILVVEGLRVELENAPLPIVEEASFSLRPGQTLGLVGESGSGKTTIALALLGYARAGARIAGGSVTVGGEDILGRREKQLRRLRGRLVSYVPQDPATAITPSFRIGKLIRAMAKGDLGDEPVGDALARVNLPSDREFRRRFPHQLSGGQQQRVAITVALIGKPPLVILDEPTTGLDVVTQALILDEIRRLRRDEGLTMVYVSHDLAVVAAIADRIAVCYAGRVVEEGPADQVLGHPHHPYTRGLVASIPDHTVPRRLRGIEGVAVGVGERPAGCAFAPRCEQRVARCAAEMPELEPAGDARTVRCFEWRRTPGLTREPPLDARTIARSGGALLEVEELEAVHQTRHGRVVAASDVSFRVYKGECVALVGESGSGKTTIARCVAGLHAPSGGRILLAGEQLAPLARARSLETRRRVQIVFQNPYDSLNPRIRIGEAIARPARLLRQLSRREASADVVRLLERVRLPAILAGRYPGELSGGERQRVAIARALAPRPELLICDEITSALDASVQAAVLELLSELRLELGLSLLFISHDLGVVASTADRVLVLDRGIVCEEGDVATVLAGPENAYTRSLVAAAPRIPDSRQASPVA